LAAKFLTDAELPNFDDEAKLERFKEASHSYGRTALLLSGGATLGYYHLGVTRALWSEDLLPPVISGSSMGAIIASAVCTRNDAEIAEWFDDIHTQSPRALVRLPLKKAISDRAILDQTALRTELEANIENLTFSEAFEQSGRVLNITVSPTRRRQKPRLLNHRTAPDVLIIPACMASAAVPGLFPPVTLERKTAEGQIMPYQATEQWADGSLVSDVPKRRLSRLQNVNHFIVSQMNPHVLPFAQVSTGPGLVPWTVRVATRLARGQSKGLLDAAKYVGLSTPVGPLLDGAHAFVGQDYGGDINIHPRFDPALYAKMFSNPSAVDLGRFVMEGQRATWPHMEIIRNQTAIGRALDSAIYRLRGRSS